MLWIRHRVNDPNELKTVSKEHGVEIDLRAVPTGPESMVVTHDPWTKGPFFSDWLSEFKRQGIQGPILLNTKEDGLEQALMEQLEAAKVTNYFFLDTTVPTLVKWVEKGLGERFFIRFSEYEPIEFVMRFEGKAKWVWADCFGGKAPLISALEQLKASYKICLVSPELHGQPIDTHREFRKQAGLADAICTKSPGEWQE